jgi:hypothetical protein
MLNQVTHTVTGQKKKAHIRTTQCATLKHSNP